jgi:hypothetical protein
MARNGDASGEAEGDVNAAEHRIRDNAIVGATPVATETHRNVYPFEAESSNPCSRLASLTQVRPGAMHENRAMAEGI